MVDPSGAYLILIDTTQVPCLLTQINESNWRAVPETTYAALNSGYSDYSAVLANTSSYSAFTKDTYAALNSGYSDYSALLANTSTYNKLTQDIDSTQVDRAVLDVLPPGVTVGFQIPDGSLLTPSQ